LIERPWDKWIKFTGGKGLVNSALFREAVLPLFNSCDIPAAITIGEVLAMGVELHIFVTNVSTMESTDLFQFPDLSVIDAISMSCALFPLFTPMNYNGKTYIDGGYSCTFPIEACLAKHDPASIFAVNICPARAECVDLQEADLSKLFAHMMVHMAYLLSDYDRSHELAKQCPSYIQINASTVLKASVWTEFLESKDHRRQLFDHGVHFNASYDAPHR
jgi:predicted acylesterase/phospholipase RssA